MMGSGIMVVPLTDIQVNIGPIPVCPTNGLI